MRVCSLCKRCKDDSVVHCIEEDHPPLSEGRSGSPEMVAGYRLEYLLDTASRGETYLARHCESDRSCVIRIHAPNSQLADAFIREANLAASLIHPNVVDVYEAGVLETGELFVVAEETEGRRLRALLRTEGPPELLTTIEIIRQTAEALHAVHQQGLIHRSVRPENIVLTTDHRNRLLVRIQNPDFGAIAERSIISNKFLIDTAIDSLRYFAPEQCAGNNAGARSDVYSLGIVLYEMLAGSPPFDAPKASALIEKHRTQPPPDVRIDNFHLRMLVTHALSEALQKNPSTRQSSANLVARQLRHIEQLATHVSTPPPAGVVPPAPARATERVNVKGGVEILPATVDATAPRHEEEPISQGPISLEEEPVLPIFDAADEVAEIADPLPARPAVWNVVKEKLAIVNSRAAGMRLLGKKARPKTAAAERSDAPPVVRAEKIDAEKIAPTKIAWEQPEDDIPTMDAVLDVLARDEAVEIPAVKIPLECEDIPTMDDVLEVLERDEVAEIPAVEITLECDDIPTMDEVLEVLARDEAAEIPAVKIPLECDDIPTMDEVLEVLARDEAAEIQAVEITLASGDPLPAIVDEPAADNAFPISPSAAPEEVRPILSAGGDEDTDAEIIPMLVERAEPLPPIEIEPPAEVTVEFVSEPVEPVAPVIAMSELILSDDFTPVVAEVVDVVVEEAIDVVPALQMQAEPAAVAEDVIEPVPSIESAQALLAMSELVLSDEPVEPVAPVLAMPELVLSDEPMPAAAEFVDVVIEEAIDVVPALQIQAEPAAIAEGVIEPVPSIESAQPLLAMSELVLSDDPVEPVAPVNEMSELVLSDEPVEPVAPVLAMSELVLSDEPVPAVAEAVDVVFEEAIDVVPALQMQPEPVAVVEEIVEPVPVLAAAASEPEQLPVAEIPASSPKMADAKVVKVRRKRSRKPASVEAQAVDILQVPIDPLPSLINSSELEVANKLPQSVEPSTVPVEETIGSFPMLQLQPEPVAAVEKIVDSVPVLECAAPEPADVVLESAASEPITLVEEIIEPVPVLEFVAPEPVDIVLESAAPIAIVEEILEPLPAIESAAAEAVALVEEIVEPIPVIESPVPESEQVPAVEIPVSRPMMFVPVRRKRARKPRPVEATPIKSEQPERIPWVRKVVKAEPKKPPVKTPVVRDELEEITVVRSRPNRIEIDLSQTAAPISSPYRKFAPRAPNKPDFFPTLLGETPRGETITPDTDAIFGAYDGQHASRSSVVRRLAVIGSISATFVFAFLFGGYFVSYVQTLTGTDSAAVKAGPAKPRVTRPGEVPPPKKKNDKAIEKSEPANEGDDQVRPIIIQAPPSRSHAPVSTVTRTSAKPEAVNDSAEKRKNEKRSDEKSFPAFPVRTQKRVPVVRRTENRIPAFPARSDMGRPRVVNERR